MLTIIPHQLGLKICALSFDIWDVESNEKLTILSLGILDQQALYACMYNYLYL